MSNRQVMQQALEALETKGEHHPRVYAAINALRTALAQEHAMHELARLGQEIEDEPVATVTSETGNPDITMSWWHEPALPIGTKLYTTPPAAQRPWQGLTERST